MAGILDFLQTPQGWGLLSPQGGGLLSGVGNVVQGNPMALTALGLGILSGQGNSDSIGRGLQGLLAGSQFDAGTRKEKRAEEEKAAQRRALAGILPKLPGVTADMAAFGEADPEAGRALVLQALKPAEQTSLQKNLIAAGLQPGTPEFRDAMIKGAMPGGNITIENGMKVPTGFMPDPNNPNGVLPIPGGPAEQMPAELAARVGLAKNFMKQAPDVEAAAGRGDMTGPVDTTLAKFGIGQAGQLHRRLESGVDALRRMLTGAGMPAAEAADYVSRYLPTYRDTSASLTDKVQQLQMELQAMTGEATKGRGGAAAPAQSDGWQDLGNGIRIRRKQ